MNKNQNKRFSMEKESDIKAWESLHSNEVGEKFKSQNRFVIEALVQNALRWMVIVRYVRKSVIGRRTVLIKRHFVMMK